MRNSRVLAATAAAAVLASSAVQAQTPEKFYAGRVVKLLLSADAGGGYASYAIAFAP